MTLSDTQICQKIATIEGYEIKSDGISNNLIKLKNNSITEYNPIENAELWTNLIFKYQVSISFVFCSVFVIGNKTSEHKFTDSESLKRKALIAIIESHQK